MPNVVRTSIHCALVAALALSATAAFARGPAPLPADVAWRKLDTVAYKGKQDDIQFVDALHGWYVNGSGKIYGTDDGGASWRELLSQPGTYFRAVGFIDAMNGFAGNIGTDYFPGVTDTRPLYRTRDGGKTWAAVEGLTEETIKGICAIDVLHSRFVNAGKLDARTIVHAGGRVGGPAKLLRSLDGGETWSAIDMTPYTAMILDVKFFDAMNGIVFGASDADVEKSHARILRTDDGGKSWKIAYESKRPFEITWKGSFPTRQVGYATIQTYDPDPAHAQRYVAKTTDGGKSWHEIPLDKDAAAREFGIGFRDARTGWVGTMNTGYQTTDGGKTWRKVEMGRAVNKIRIVPDGDGFVGYAIGMDVYKLDMPATGGAAAKPH
ncbi:MAG: WD40/YVTN/BNR-like repeat-containing protein [Lysobacteraceae bacterium]